MPFVVHLQDVVVLTQHTHASNKSKSSFTLSLDLMTVSIIGKVEEGTFWIFTPQAKVPFN